jgi:hypothetical protein
LERPDPSKLAALLQTVIGDELRYRRFVRRLEEHRTDGEFLFWQVQILDGLEKTHGLALPRNASELLALLPVPPRPESLEAHEVPHWIRIEALGGQAPVQGDGTMGDWRWYFRARGEHWSLSAELGPDADPVMVFDNSDTTFYVEAAYGDFEFDASYMPLGEVRFVLVRELTHLRDRVRTSSRDARFATYGAWDINAFVRTFPDELVNVAIVQVRPDANSEASRIASGAVVARLWAAILDRFRGVHGHRLMWLDLAFFMGGTDLESTARAMAPLTLDAPAGIRIWFAVASASADPTQRLTAVDQLACDLGKVEYRGRYPSAWCGRDGRILHRPEPRQ